MTSLGRDVSGVFVSFDLFCTSQLHDFHDNLTNHIQKMLKFGVFKNKDSNRFNYSFSPVFCRFLVSVFVSLLSHPQYISPGLLKGWHSGWLSQGRTTVHWLSGVFPSHLQLWKLFTVHTVQWRCIWSYFTNHRLLKRFHLLTREIYNKTFSFPIFSHFFRAKRSWPLCYVVPRTWWLLLSRWSFSPEVLEYSTYSMTSVLTRLNT